MTWFFNGSPGPHYLLIRGDRYGAEPGEYCEIPDQFAYAVAHFPFTVVDGPPLDEPEQSETSPGDGEDDEDEPGDETSGAAPGDASSPAPSDTTPESTQSHSDVSLSPEALIDTPAPSPRGVSDARPAPAAQKPPQGKNQKKNKRK